MPQFERQQADGDGREFEFGRKPHLPAAVGAGAPGDGDTLRCIAARVATRAEDREALSVGGIVREVSEVEPGVGAMAGFADIARLFEHEPAQTAPFSTVKFPVLGTDRHGPPLSRYSTSGRETEVRRQKPEYRAAFRWTLAALYFLAAAAEFPYRQAVPGHHYEFPRDYFEHREFRTEWWYYTGNVRTAAGKRFGFELVFFRQGERREPAENPSAWRVDDVYLAHLALTDIGAGRFVYRRRLNRAGPGIAGASFDQRRVWNGNWSAEWNGDEQMLRAVAEGIRFELRLKPLKPVVIHGENGVSRKAAGAGKASCYISFPRLAVEGSLNGAAVTGTAWMDHEWFTHQLESYQAGWDWFSVQLDNGTELMLFELRRKDGSIDPYSSGTYVDRAGKAHHLTARDFSLQPLAARYNQYPIEWRIAVPRLGIALDSRAAVADQELTSEGAGPAYWEGAVTYSGSASGVGYLEMTGYGRPVLLE